MKKNLIIIIMTAAALFTAAAFISFSIKDSEAFVNDSAGNTGTASEEKHSCCSSEESEEFSDNSIYQLESEWLNQDNKTFELSELKGNPVVLTMFFASCTYACPILVNDMKKIEAAIPDVKLDDYKFVLVSIDPERDSPEMLKNFAKAKNLDASRWILLTGSSDDIMELAALTGFKYRKEKTGEYSHSNMILLLNEEGEITHQHNGLNQDLTAALTAINEL